MIVLSNFTDFHKKKDMKDMSKIIRPVEEISKKRLAEKIQ
jgi:hypothetical protein